MSRVPHPSQQMLIDGILLVDKPETWTSHDVCAFVRGRFRIKKVGHAGTLDPMATGLLVLLLGRATKHSIELTGCDKEYEGSMKLGVQTDSHDRTGNIIREIEPADISIEDIRKAAEKFTGAITQVPPMVSAIKHKGVRLYKLARKGQEVPREGREVYVDEFDIREKKENRVTFFARVSKGTYVRTLVNDLGESMKTLATLNDLRRVRSGNFSVEKSLTIEELKEIPPAELRARVLPLSAIPSYAYPQ